MLTDANIYYWHFNIVLMDIKTTEIWCVCFSYYSAIGIHEQLFSNKEDAVAFNKELDNFSKLMPGKPMLLSEAILKIKNDVIYETKRLI